MVGSAWKVMAAVEEIMIVKITARRGRVALHALAWSLGQVGAALCCRSIWRSLIRFVRQ